jgi:hypothetical protein
MGRLGTFLLGMALLGCGAVQAEEAPAAIDLRAAMAPEEFTVAGLGRLSEEELATLGRWLTRQLHGQRPPYSPRQ